MGRLTAYILLIVFAIICDVSQCLDDCFYQPSHPGKKCYDEQHTMYTCCPHDHSCNEGKCISLNAAPPSNRLPIYTSVLIGVGVGVFALVGIIIIGAIYRHRKQMKMTEIPYNAFASFSKSTNTPSRTGSSVGFRARSFASEPPSPEASVTIQIPSITKS